MAEERLNPLTWLQSKFASFDDIYPVGSIYMSVNSTDPSTLFGGTWVQLTDTFLLACGSTYSSDGSNVTTAQHGSATVSLTQSEMPRHTHTNQETQTIII